MQFRLLIRIDLQAAWLKCSVTDFPREYLLLRVPPLLVWRRHLQPNKYTVLQCCAEYGATHYSFEHSLIDSIAITGGYPEIIQKPLVATRLSEE